MTNERKAFELDLPKQLKKRFMTGEYAGQYVDTTIEGQFRQFCKGYQAASDVESVRVDRSDAVQARTRESKAVTLNDAVHIAYKASQIDAIYSGRSSTVKKWMFLPAIKALAAAGIIKLEG